MVNRAWKKVGRIGSTTGGSATGRSRPLNVQIVPTANACAFQSLQLYRAAKFGTANCSHEMTLRRFSVSHGTDHQHHHIFFIIVFVKANMFMYISPGLTQLQYSPVRTASKMTTACTPHEPAVGTRPTTNPTSLQRDMRAHARGVVRWQAMPPVRSTRQWLAWRAWVRDVLEGGGLHTATIGWVEPDCWRGIRSQTVPGRHSAIAREQASVWRPCLLTDPGGGGIYVYMNIHIYIYIRPPRYVASSMSFDLELCILPVHAPTRVIVTARLRLNDTPTPEGKAAHQSTPPSR